MEIGPQAGKPDPTTGLTRLDAGIGWRYFFFFSPGFGGLAAAMTFSAGAADEVVWLNSMVKTPRPWVMEVRSSG